MQGTPKRDYDSKAELWSLLKMAMKEKDEAKSKGDNEKLTEIERKIENLKHEIKK